MHSPFMYLLVAAVLIADEIAQQIVENLLSRENVCLDMTDLRSYDDYTLCTFR